MGRAPSLLSMVSVTSARPSGGREVVPAKTTSSILPPRSDFTPCSPMTQDNASTMLDLPEPFGPTTHVMPGSSRRVVAEANDLKPRRVRLFRYTCRPSSRSPHLAVRRRPKRSTADGLAGWVPAEASTVTNETPEVYFRARLIPVTYRTNGISRGDNNEEGRHRR